MIYLAFNDELSTNYMQATSIFAFSLHSVMPIPMILQIICFRTSEQIMIKALVFINGFSLKKRSNDEHDLLSRPQRASLKGSFAALLISTRGATILFNQCLASKPFNSR